DGEGGQRSDQHVRGAVAGGAVGSQGQRPGDLGGGGAGVHRGDGDVGGVEVQALDVALVVVDGLVVREVDGLDLRDRSRRARGDLELLVDVEAQIDDAGGERQEQQRGEQVSAVHVCPLHKAFLP